MRPPHIQKIFSAILCLSFIAPSPLSAHSAEKGHIRIGHIWAYPMKPGDQFVDVYGPILNIGDNADEITSIKTPVAKAVTFCTVDAKKTEPACGPVTVKLAAQEPLSLNDKRHFVRLSQTNVNFVKGDHIPLTFTFRNNPEIELHVVVQTEAGKEQ